jgi:hypothetical protein
VLQLVDITRPWPLVDCDRETHRKACRKKLGKYEPLIAELKRVYPGQKVDQGTIALRATGVFHKRSQVEFAKATRLEKKELPRYRRNAVDMALQGSCQVFTESIERAEHRRQHPTQLEAVAILK